NASPAADLKRWDDEVARVESTCLVAYFEDASDAFVSQGEIAAERLHPAAEQQHIEVAGGDGERLDKGLVGTVDSRAGGYAAFLFSRSDESGRSHGRCSLCLVSI